MSSSPGSIFRPFQIHANRSKVFIKPQHSPWPVVSIFFLAFLLRKLKVPDATFQRRTHFILRLSQTMNNFSGGRPARAPRHISNGRHWLFRWELIIVAAGKAFAGWNGFHHPCLSVIVVVIHPLFRRVITIGIRLHDTDLWKSGTEVCISWCERVKWATTSTEGHDINDTLLARPGAIFQLGRIRAFLCTTPSSYLVAHSYQWTPSVLLSSRDACAKWSVACLDYIAMNSIYSPMKRRWVRW